MSAEELTQATMTLPLKDRLALAQMLWQSIETGRDDGDPRAAIHEAITRDRELDSGAAIGRPHDEVMQAARRAIACD